ncbi:MAG TPA: MotA/TolQ/ExbB proton channel family protein [Chthoniobacterales bacterium]
MSLHDNVVVQTFLHGGPIMWPILATAVVALAVVIERFIWQIVEKSRRRPQQVDEVLSKIEVGDVDGASKLARNSKDPFLRVMWHGLHHFHSSLQGALQRAATTEVERAERFLSILDTIVTLAPLLGLLGTVTGIMHSFSFVGNEDLAATKVSGGIAEALIATAAGLGIAIFCLLPLNYFNRRVETFRTELENTATDVELLANKSKQLATV